MILKHKTMIFAVLVVSQIILINIIDSESVSTLFRYSYEQDSYIKVICLYTMFLSVILPQILYIGDRNNNYYSLLLTKYKNTIIYDTMLIKRNIIATCFSFFVIFSIVNILTCITFKCLYIDLSFMIVGIIYFAAFLSASSIVFQKKESVILNYASPIPFIIFSSHIKLIMVMIVIIILMIIVKQFNRGDIL